MPSDSGFVPLHYPLALFQATQGFPFFLRPREQPCTASFRDHRTRGGGGSRFSPTQRVSLETEFSEKSKIASERPPVIWAWCECLCYPHFLHSWAALLSITFSHWPKLSLLHLLPSPHPPEPLVYELSQSVSPSVPQFQIRHLSYSTLSPLFLSLHLNGYSPPPSSLVLFFIAHFWFSVRLTPVIQYSYRAQNSILTGTPWADAGDSNMRSYHISFHTGKLKAFTNSFPPTPLPNPTSILIHNLLQSLLWGEGSLICYVSVPETGFCNQCWAAWVGQRNGHVRQRLHCERKALLFHRDVKKVRGSTEFLESSRINPPWEHLKTFKKYLRNRERGQEQDAQAGFGSTHFGAFKCFC